MRLKKKINHAQKQKSKQQNKNLSLAINSLDNLINDKNVPEKVRIQLSQEYQQLEAMLEKLEKGHFHISAIGRVSVGKSSLLNALLGKDRFSVSVLHGETKQVSLGEWQSVKTGGVFLQDTPGLNEINGKDREKLALDVAQRSDLVLFVIDGDMTHSELQALKTIHNQNRAILVVLNKIDRYTPLERQTLKDTLVDRLNGIISSELITFASSTQRDEKIIRINEEGQETIDIRQIPPDIEALKKQIWRVIENEGETLLALNASLFAGDFDKQINTQILEVKEVLANRVVRTYCVSKGLTVAVNPVPVADLLAAALMDISLIIHLGKVYGLPMSKREAGRLIKVICAQMLALMGATWAVHVLSSSLKITTVGVSTALTATGQSIIAYYSTYVVGQVAKSYFANGKAWKVGGVKQTVAEILENIDRDSIFKDAKQEIKERLRFAN